MAFVTRFAPSPTGPLHLGHACTFVANWLLARKSGWRLLLRLDDLDAPRVQSSGHDVLDTLRWLGLDWDGEPIRQSARLDRYRAAMHALAQAGVVYESPHTRSEVREAAAAVGAPHEGEGHARFPDTESLQMRWRQADRSRCPRRETRHRDHRCRDTCPRRRAVSARKSKSIDDRSTPAAP